MPENVEMRLFSIYSALIKHYVASIVTVSHIIFKPQKLGSVWVWGENLPLHN
jgi:hypothetical protein